MGGAVITNTVNVTIATVGNVGIATVAAVVMFDFPSKGIARERSVLESAGKVNVYASLAAQTALRIVRVAGHVTYLKVQITEPSTEVVSKTCLDVTV